MVALLYLRASGRNGASMTKEQRERLIRSRSNFSSGTREAIDALLAAYDAAQRDSAALEWALPIITGDDTPEVNARMIAVGIQLMLGKTGRDAIDAAIAATNAQAGEG